MSLELILMSDGINPDARDKAEAAYEQIRKSIGLISSVRKLSSIDLHVPELIETDIHVVTSKAIRLVKHAFPEKKPEIEITFDQRKIMVMADGAYLCFRYEFRECDTQWNMHGDGQGVFHNQEINFELAGKFVKLCL